MLAVNGKNGGVVLLGQLQNKFTCNNQCFLVGQTNGLACLDGVDGGVETGETYHGSEHHVDRTCLYYLVERLSASIYLHVGHVAHQRLQFVITLLVSNDDGGGLELMSLLCQQLYFIVGCQTVHFVQV